MSTAPEPAQRPGAVLAIDHGTRKSGFAAADPLRIAVRPLETWRGRGDSPELLEHVERLVAQRDVRTVVVGWPGRGDGRAGAPEGARAAEVRAFCAQLAARLGPLGVLVCAQDERLSTKAAEDLLREAGVPRSRHRELRDSWSALVVLRDWIAQGEPPTPAPPPASPGTRAAPP